MFWKVIKWGGTAVIVLIVIASLVLNSGSNEPSANSNPVPVAPTTKFNF